MTRKGAGLNDKYLVCRLIYSARYVQAKVPYRTLSLAFVF